MIVHNIKIADYLDEDNRIDEFKLNSDVRFNLTLDSDVSERLSDYDRVWANVRFRSENTNDNGNTDSMYLHAEDHDSEYDYGPDFEEPSVKTYIESNDDGTSSVEFSFSSWDLRDAANYLKEGESSITYSLENINAISKL